MSRFRALPYARALYDVVADSAPERAERVIDELRAVAEALGSVSELQRAMVTPMVAPDTKTAILDQVLDTLGVEEPTRRFVHVVQQHYRLEHMPAIVDRLLEISPFANQEGGLSWSAPPSCHV